MACHDVSCVAKESHAQQTAIMVIMIMSIMIIILRILYCIGLGLLLVVYRTSKAIVAIAKTDPIATRLRRVFFSLLDLSSFVATFQF